MKLSGTVSQLVSDDMGARNAASTPHAAIGRLRRASGGRRSERPYRLIDRILDTRPQLLDMLHEDQRESVQILILSRMLAESAGFRDARRTLDGRLLAIAWNDLSDEARATFPAHTDAAVRSLAERATPKAEIFVQMPSDLAQALLTDGELARWLNGG